METIVRLYIPNPDKKTAWLIKTSRNQVEFIRADVFIKMACEWLKENACNYASTAAYSTVVNYDEEFLVEDFKKYMEGKDEVHKM